MVNFTVIDCDELTGVEIVSREGVSCIRLSFKQNAYRFLNIQRFGKDKLTKAKSLIGKAVTVSCWDPPNQPGLYSNNGWWGDISLKKGVTPDEASAVGGLANFIDTYVGGLANPSYTYNGQGRKERSAWMIEKGACAVCGVKNNLLTISHDSGKSWMHWGCAEKMQK